MNKDELVDYCKEASQTISELGYKNRMLEKENQELKKQVEDVELNWEIIKQYCLDEQIPEEYDEYNSYIEFSNSVYDDIFNKMKNLELEQGSDSNEKDKKIEKIDIDNDKMTLNGYETIPTQLFEVARKVNELIDEVNKLKEGKE